MPIRTTFAALSLSLSLAVLAAPPVAQAPRANGPQGEDAHPLAANDVPPLSCPLCGGSNFADFQALLRVQKMAAFAVALTI